MIGLLRLLKGYISFCAEGGFPERFLNLCKLRGINLWNIKNDGAKVEACTTVAEFERIKEPAENSGMDIKVLKSRGLTFFLKRHKWRCGAAFGLLLAVLSVWFMSGFIWEVEIVEAKGAEIESLAESLEELGVKKGARKSEIDILEVQEKLLNEYPELSWVSLNIFGDKAQVEYTPVKRMTEQKDTSAPMNIVAKKSGKITLVEGYRGTNKVKEGAYVAKGSLLISGVLVNADGSEKFVRASGKVYAQTQNTETVVTENKVDGLVTAAPQKRYCINFFNLVIPLGFSLSGDYSADTEMMLRGNSAVLPVGILREDAFSTGETEVRLSEKELQLLSLTECVSKKRGLYGNSELQRIEFSQAVTDKSLQISMEIVCVEDIATEKAVYVEEN